jgi:hypothetical protein
MNAKRIVSSPCCRRECMKTIPLDKAVAVATGCLNELHGMSQLEKKMYLLEKVRGCVKTKHDSGFISFSWKIGIPPAPRAMNVCRFCFMNMYCCSHGYIDGIVRDLKGGVRSYDRPSSGRANLNFIHHLESLAEYHGVKLTREQKQAITIPNSIQSLSCFGWMQNFFNFVGEHQPSVDEIHLDPCTVTHIYDEYKQVLEDVGEVSVCHIYFCLFS